MLDTGQPRTGAASPGVWGAVVFAAIFVLGVFYVKWDPYFHKALAAAAHHTLGASIVSGRSAAPPAPSWHSALAYALSYGAAIWQALVVGLLVGAGIQTLLPRQWLLRVLGSGNRQAPLVAGLAAVPAMMWTCCSAPPAVGLAKSTASLGATLAFWLGNPLLNPATMVFMGFVLGWKWVALRIAAAVVLVFGVAPWAARLAPSGANRKGGGRTVTVEQPLAGGGVGMRYLQALWQLAKGLLPEYAVILLVLGAVRAWLFPGMNPMLGHSPALMLFLAVAGTLFVIPTAGEIPIVQTLMHFGLGAGGAGVLLTTLPAVSLPSLVMVGRAVPAKPLLAVAAAVAVVGLATGAVALALGF